MTPKNMVNTLVSVGIPTFNRPEGLRQTLDCILGQTYQKIEIIISDNCSTNPEVARIADEFSKKDSRIRYIRQPENIGALRNFIFLVEQAQGEFFMWAADDDWWAPTFIMASVSLLETKPSAAIALPRFTAFITSGQSTKKLPASFDKICEFENKNIFERLLTYIQQKEIYGKAHIIYGLMRHQYAVLAMAETLKIISPLTNAYIFNPLDTIFNAVLLSQGDIVTDDNCLRRYHYAPRRSATKKLRNFWQRFLGYDRTAIIYFNCFYPFIENLTLTASEKKLLRRAVLQRKINFIMERIGRRMLVYKIYWYFKKQLCFKPVSS